MAEVGRNAPCPCGSGKKYKQCCLGSGGPQSKKRLVIPIVILVLALVAGGVGYFYTGSITSGLAIAGAGIVSAGAIAIFMDPPPPRAGGGSADSINFGT